MPVTVTVPSGAVTVSGTASSSPLLDIQPRLTATPTPLSSCNGVNTQEPGTPSRVGAWVLYGVSAAIGPIRVHNFTVKYGRWFGVSAHDLDRAEDWFDDHSNTAVLICRCVPLIRSLVSVPAGFRRMAPMPFTIYTTIGSAVWNTLLVGAGYLLGDNWEQVAEYIDVIQYAVIAVILLAVAYWVWTRLISSEHKARREAQEAAAIQEFAEDDAERLEELASEDQS